jgi:hypothetical protein
VFPRRPAVDDDHDHDHHDHDHHDDSDSDDHHPARRKGHGPEAPEPVSCEVAARGKAEHEGG